MHLRALFLFLILFIQIMPFLGKYLPDYGEDILQM